MKDLRTIEQPDGLDTVVAATPKPAQAPAAPVRDDRMVLLGWKYDPARDRLGAERTVYTLYRDVQKREGAIVSFILIARA